MTGVVAFSSYHYKYPSGREGDCALASFSPCLAASVQTLRKQDAANRRPAP